MKPRSGVGVLGYAFVGLTAVVMLMAFAVVLVEVSSRGRVDAAPAGVTLPQR